MILTRWSLRRPVTTLMCVLGAVVLGIVAFTRLPVQLIPDFTLPTIGVYVTRPGSSANETLDELTRPVESIIAELPRLKGLRSWSGSWGTWIRADFEVGTDIRFTTLDLQERLNGFQQGLADRRTQINVMPFSTDEFKNFLMDISVEGTSDRKLLDQLVRDRIEPRLRSISGVATVDVGSVVSDAALVELDADLLAGYRLNFMSVFQRLQSAGVDDTYLGSIQQPDETWYARVQAPIQTLPDLRELPITDDGLLTLEDVALIEPAETLDDWLYRANGRTAVGIRISREEGQNLIRVARTVRAQIKELEEILPEGVYLSVETDAAEMVERVIRDLRNLAVAGALMALLVPLIFFRSWRIALIIFLSVPICVLIVFNLFAVSGMSINIFSIIGLALGVGMLVDNSIVVVENCFRLYFSSGYSSMQAAEYGGSQVGRALLASTVTSCVPFLALYFLEGDFRMFIREPALALVYPLMLSLVVALTLSAVLSQKTLNTVMRHEGKQGLEERQKVARRLNPTRSFLRRGYRRVLKGSLRNRWRVIGVISLLMAFVWLEACDKVSESTVNREQQNEHIYVYLELPAGSPTSETSETARYVEEQLAKLVDVERFGTWVRDDRANFWLKLHRPKDRPTGRSASQIRAGLIAEIGDPPQGELTFTPSHRRAIEAPTGIAGTGRVELRATDPDTLNRFAESLIESLRQLPEIRDASMVERNPTDQYVGSIDRVRTGLFGLTAQSLGQYLGLTRSSGTISSLQLRDGDKRTDVSIAMRRDEITTREDVDRISVYTPSGVPVPYGELVSWDTQREIAGFARVNRQSSLSVEYSWYDTESAGTVLREVRSLLQNMPGASGITYEFQGDQRQLEQRQADFIFSLLVGALLIFIVMAAVFESLWIPFTILLTNPLMLIGIVIALAITGLPFEELAAFGVLLLNGLAVNNGIVMMDTVLRFRREHAYRRLRAVFQAGDQRFRPIVMTFLTTALGLLPMAIFGDEDSQWRPVAVTVLGGLTSATLLTLIVLPCFYMIGDDFMLFCSRWIKGPLQSALATVERAINAIWHPITVLRGVPRFIVRIFRLAWKSIKLVWRIVSGIVRFGWRSPRELRFAFRGTRSRVAQQAPPADLLASGQVPDIIVRNLHVHGDRLPFGRSKGTKRRFLRQKALILQRVNLRLVPGLNGLLGPNGAGKTTFIRALARIETPSRGSVVVADEARPPHVSYLPQHVEGYHALTLRESLEMAACEKILREHALVSGLPVSAPAIATAAREVNLEPNLDQRIGTLSGGMRRRAAMARVLLEDGEMVLVDEPSAGLDLMESLRLRQLLSILSRDRVVVLSTHLVKDLESSIGRIAVLSRGRLLADENPDAVLARAEGHFWESTDAVPPGALVLRTTPEQSGVRHRFASFDRPTGNALSVVPNLEEAFLWLLHIRGEVRGA